MDILSNQLFEKFMLYGFSFVVYSIYVLFVVALPIIPALLAEKYLKWNRTVLVVISVTVSSLLICAGAFVLACLFVNH